MISGSQVWSMEKLENKLIDMREMYQEHKDRPLDMMVRKIKFQILNLLHKKKENILLTNRYCYLN